MMTAIGLLALYLGIVIATAGVVGIYRFPDVYTRLNALSKVTTVGAVLIHLSSATLLPWGEGGKGVLTAFVLLVTTPVVTQAIGWTAHWLNVPNVNHRDEYAAAQRAGSD